ncbi:MAG TPA: tripartite tricarboxylate transporter substrate-binding protein [Beijerinckiaceae bacterium]|jgi:tripartite-type tricarboxylate transporter receptor subunit TctC
MMPSRRLALTAGALAAAAGLAGLVGPAAAQSVEEFYKDKTLTIYVGLSAGGGYDINARLVAKYIGRYIPGNPTVVVRNMPGGGGLVMTNYVANVAAKDGLHMGAPQRGIPFEPLLGDASHARFDPLKLNWIGSVNSDTSVAIATKKSGVKSWQDLKNRELIVAGTGIGTESVVAPYVLRNVLGLKFKVIAGYPGGSEMNLAMQRGEVDGRGTYSWTSLKPQYNQFIRDEGMVILYQMGLKKHPDLKDVPLVIDLAENDEQKKLLELQFTAFELGRPLFVAEGVPADRVNALRRAFDKAMEDKELLADVEKQQLEVNPSSGEEMQDILKRVYATPKDLVAKLQEASKATPEMKAPETKAPDKK